MKYLLLLVSGILVLGVSSCKKDASEGTVTIHFKAVYNEETLETFSTRPFENGEQLQFSHLSMFISDLELMGKAESVALDENELVNLSFDTPSSAAEGYTLKITNIPAGSYDGIRFGIGVPPDLNQKKPADFSSDNPLSNTGYYWIPWNSYIFMKTEGRLDTLGNGNLDLGFALHSGSDALYRILEGAVPITVEDGKETTLDIVIDYKKLLQGVDIKANPQNHTPDDLTAITAIVNNLAIAISLVL